MTWKQTSMDFNCGWSGNLWETFLYGLDLMDSILDCIIIIGAAWAWSSNFWTEGWQEVQHHSYYKTLDLLQTNKYILVLRCFFIYAWNISGLSSHGMLFVWLTSGFFIQQSCTHRQFWKNDFTAFIGTMYVFIWEYQLHSLNVWWCL